MKPYTAKINTAGSWANLLTFSPSRLADVKAACEQLASAMLGPIAFKVIDGDTGNTVAQFSQPPRPGEPHGWHEPRRP